MRPNKALQFFKTRKAMADAAGGVSKQAICQWFKADLVPWRSAVRLREASGGKLQLDLKLYA